MTQKRQDRLDEKLDRLIEGVGDIKTKVAVLNESFSICSGIIILLV